MGQQQHSAKHIMSALSLINVDLILLSEKKYFRELVLSGYEPNTFRKVSRLTTLKKLLLDECSIKLIPKGICQLSNLELLSLTHNKIEEISDEIFSLTGLKELNLLRNNIKVLPSRLSLLINLQRLSLTSNNLRDIPEHIFLLTSLCSLFLASNNIARIPSGITNLRCLKILDLNSNGIKEIPDTISILTSLRTIMLQRNPIGHNALSPALKKLNLVSIIYLGKD